jgi:hypothetical protein
VLRIEALIQTQRTRDGICAVAARSALGIALMLAFASPRLTEAAPESPQSLAIHGFGSWAYGKTGGNNYLAGTPDGEYRTSELSLDVSVDFGNRLRAVSQVFFEEGSEEVGAQIDYAFAEWSYSDALKFRVGEIKLPFGISAEVFDVGTLRPFFRLPQSIYGPVGVIAESYKGIGATGERSTLGDWTLTYDAYLGGIEARAFDAPLEGLRGDAEPAPLEHEHAVTRNVIGGRLVIGAPRDGLAFGGSAYSGTTELKQRRLAIGVQGEYLNGDWSLRAEVVRHTVAGTLRMTGGYVEAARMFGVHWQGALQYNSLKEAHPGLDDARAPSLGEHKEVALGVNYWFSSNFVVKLACHQVTGNRIAAPELEELRDGVLNGDLQTRTRLIQLGAQFSF